MRVIAAGKTDVGQVRGHNEDFFLTDEALGLYVVCDGMGGHAAGEVASRTTAETLRERLAGESATDANGLARALEQAVVEANRRIYALGEEDKQKRGMGTTCTALIVRGGQAAMAHVGDSRLYLARAGELHQLSSDHTFLADAIRHGILTPEQAKESEHSNIVTRAVGPQARVIVDTLVFDVLPGDRLLLCSDGLHEYFDDAAELHRLLSNGAADVAEQLVGMANGRGGHDNITALVLEVEAAPAPEGVAERERATEVTANLQALRHVHLFTELDMAELTKVCARLDSLLSPPGAVVLEQGEVGEALYVIVDGEAIVERDGAEIARLPAGSHFGDMALLNQRPRTATVRAVGECRMVRLPRDAFYALVQEDTVLGIKFLWRLAQTLSLRLDDAFQTPTQEEVERKTLAYGLFPSPFHNVPRGE